MRRFFEIMGNSFRLALLELRNNKLRTTLSLLGVTFGIFCIIGVLATVNSLETNVQNDIKKLGDNTIYIDKWVYGGGGGDYPWWKFVNRPEPTFEEMEKLKQDTAIVGKITFVLDNQANVETQNSVLERIEVYGPSAGFETLQPFEMQYGRYFSASELEKGSPIAVIGYTNAEVLFGKPEKAIGQKNQKGGQGLFALAVGVVHAGGVLV
jgi:putative ABC transport system permease protein